MLTSIVVMGLITAAILYGIFFLAFKLIWIICSSKRNFWPLILAGIATAFVVLMLVVASWKIYKRVIVPFQPIITAAQEQTEPIIGSHVYIDKQHGFQITLHNGMVLSDWITLDPSSHTDGLMGFDINVLLENKNNQTEQNNSFEGLFLLHQVAPSRESALQMANALAQKLEQTRSSRGEIRLLSQPQPLDIGPQVDAAVLSAEMVADGVTQTVPLICLVVLHGTERYYVAGFGTGPIQETVTSFHLSAE